MAKPIEWWLVSVVVTICSTGTHGHAAIQVVGGKLKRETGHKQENKRTAGTRKRSAFVFSKHEKKEKIRENTRQHFKKAEEK
jgi:hypothetical protein